MSDINWRRKWQPTAVFLPGKSYGQRSLEGYSPWGLKELDMTEATQHTRTDINPKYNIQIIMRYSKNGTQREFIKQKHFKSINLTFYRKN